MATTVKRGWLVAALSAAVAVLLGSALVTAAWAGAFGPDVAAASRTRLGPGGPGVPSGSSRAVPNLPGAVVHVSLTNMGGPMMGQRTPMHRGVMRVNADKVTVPAGTVSFAVANDGSVVHELVILPLGDSQAVGTRPIGADGKIDEASGPGGSGAGSLGEASNSGGEGTGDGIRPGATGWITVTLTPGRYELVCNLPGHYGAGMSTELTVS
jgi:uncharacterized cupredoxin-like copper-binding protein